MAHFATAHRQVGMEEEGAGFFGAPSFRSRLRDPDRNGLRRRSRLRVVMMITTIMMMVMELGRQMMRYERGRRASGGRGHRGGYFEHEGEEEDKADGSECDWKSWTAYMDKPKNNFKSGVKSIGEKRHRERLRTTNARYLRVAKTDDQECGNYLE